MADTKPSTLAKTVTFRVSKDELRWLKSQRLPRERLSACIRRLALSEK